jgi:hypothetical protein
MPFCSYTLDRSPWRRSDVNEAAQEEVCTAWYVVGGIHSSRMMILLVAIDVTAPLSPRLQALVHPPPTPFDQLMRLDSWYRPGLTEEQFKELITTCTCGMVMTRRVFNYHMCVGSQECTCADEREPEVIDLT